MSEEIEVKIRAMKDEFIRIHEYINALLIGEVLETKEVEELEMFLDEFVTQIKSL